jgi:hypothetical protein
MPSPYDGRPPTARHAADDGRQTIRVGYLPDDEQHVRVDGQPKVRASEPGYCP